MVGLEVIGVFISFLLPILLYILNNIRADVKENRKDIKYILQHLQDKCDKCD